MSELLKAVCMPLLCQNTMSGQLLTSSLVKVDVTDHFTISSGLNAFFYKVQIFCRKNIMGFTGT